MISTFSKYHQWCKLVRECIESAATARIPDCCCWIENAQTVELGVICLLALLLHSWLEHINSQSAQISHRKSRMHIFAVHVFSFLVVVFLIGLCVFYYNDDIQILLQRDTGGFELKNELKESDLHEDEVCR